MPSPTMPTRLPPALSSFTALALPPGRIPALNSSMPACAAMAAAVLGLSPVSMTTRIPRRRNLSIAARDVGRKASAMAKIASISPPSASTTTVFPSCCQWRTMPSSSSPSHSGAPRRSERPATTPSTPWPAQALKPLTGSMASSAAAATMARAKGCSEFCSNAAARRSASPAGMPRASLSVT
ncbi:hypothetical protein SDC9_143516 [bioreactor metagenome]|uniref:Uncharacterized protein n=1 Tax=bioreactor metagenome TaxID=1076179 RepID=A0A645E4B7_9ZZZZ